MATDIAKNPIPPRQSMLLVILVQKLRLQPGHVDVGGTFALASLAFQTKVEHFLEGGVGKTFQSQLAGDRQAQGISSAAGAVLFLARRLIRGTHRPFALFSTFTHAGA